MVIQERSPLALRQSSFLIAALTKTRVTSGCEAAALTSAIWAEVQIEWSTSSRLAATTFTAAMLSRSERDKVWDGIGVSQISASRPI